MTDPLATVKGGEILAQHLRLWAGAWPPSSDLTVVANPRRAQPAWDGRLAPAVGVETASDGAVLGVDPAYADAVGQYAQDRELTDVLEALPVLLDRPGVGVRGIFRWTVEPASLPDAGVWLDVDDPRVPPWLKPFGGEVLVELERDEYIAGVGIKRHDDFGHELAVVTEEAARGRGLARRLVASAARRVVDEGRVATYLHAPDNVASARVAVACGFSDDNWRVLGFFPR